MSTTLYVVVGIFLAVLLITPFLYSRSFIFRFIVILIALGFAVFSVFGFLASFEPSGTSNLPWKIAYAVIGIGSLTASVMLLRHSFKKS